ncbi:MAG: GNAT family N-acetyltransferase [Flavobacteriaceae bacterium]|nr:GNAT family N-acetyltransferase [Flavobacteriaceae bacterium]
MSRVLEIDIDNPSWNEYVNKSEKFDFYHTASYHVLETTSNNFRPLLFIVEQGGNFIGLPLVIREIDGSSYFDCTSTYGYVGALSNLSFSEIPETLISSFQQELDAFFKRENVVAAFSRLHPLIASEKVFQEYGAIREVNKTVAIDLAKTPEEQRQQYRKSNKSEINQLRKKKGYSVIEATSEDQLKVFVEIYKETMNRVEASQYYYFDEAYFRSILTAPDYDTKLLLAMKEGEITAGAIFTIANGFMQYHLAGTKEDYVYDTPMKLILDEARLIANELGLELLHLGGGVGGSDEDSLFRFKSGFSKDFFQFKTWQYIASKTKYDELAAQNGVENSDYFPIYRAPKQ